MALALEKCSWSRFLPRYLIFLRQIILDLYSILFYRHTLSVAALKTKSGLAQFQEINIFYIIYIIYILYIFYIIYYILYIFYIIYIIYILYIIYIILYIYIF